MEPDRILIRYGEMWLKAGNKYHFETKLVENVRQMTGIKPQKIRGRLLLPFFAEHQQLQRVFGITSYSLAYKAEKNIENIQKKAAELLSLRQGTFKIETKRSDKRFPLNSLQINAEAGKYIEAHTSLEFNFAHPDIMLYIEINNAGAFLFTETFPGAGGLPVGTAGRVYLRSENGADLLAGLLMMKRGCSVIIVNDDHPIDLLQKFSPRKIKEAKEIPADAVMVSGETLETRKKNSRLALKPLIGYRKEEIGKELERYGEI